MAKREQSQTPPEQLKSLHIRSDGPHGKVLRYLKRQHDATGEPISVIAARCVRESEGFKTWSQDADGAAQ